MKFWFADKKFNEKINGLYGLLQSKYPLLAKSLKAKTEEAQKQLEKVIYKKNPTLIMDFKGFLKRKMIEARGTIETKEKEAGLSEIESKLQDL